MRRAAGRAALTAVAALLFLPGVVLAHLALTRSDPASGAALAAAPERLRLWFTESPRLGLSRLVLLSVAGDTIPLGDLGREGDDPPSMSADVRGDVAGGSYMIHWTAVGNDGHPRSGMISFTVDEPDAPAAGADSVRPAPAGGQPGGQDEHAHHMDTAGEDEPISPTEAAVRWLWLVPLVLVIGATVFHHVVLPRVRSGDPASVAELTGRATARVATLGLWAAGAAVIAAAVRLLAQTAAIFGGDRAFDVQSIGALFTETSWGWGWAAYAAAAVIALAGFAMARAGRTAGWALAGVAAFAFAFAPALTGHAIADSERAVLYVVLDAIHVAGASAWVGTLALLAAAGIPSALSLAGATRADTAAALVRAFSPVALTAAAIAAGSGVVAAVLHLPTVSSLVEEPWGQTLLVKLALVAVMGGIGAYNWKRVTPALTDEPGALRMRRSAWTEFAVGALVLAVTAVLIMTPPPMR